MFDYFFCEVIVVGTCSILFAGVVVDDFTFDAVYHILQNLIFQILCLPGMNFKGLSSLIGSVTGHSYIL